MILNVTYWISLEKGPDLSTAVHKIRTSICQPTLRQSWPEIGVHRIGGDIECERCAGLGRELGGYVVGKEAAGFGEGKVWGAPAGDAIVDEGLNFLRVDRRAGEGFDARQVKPSGRA